jgi:uncharacterized protein involved in exopolysaccharide biosynthesis
VGRTYTFDEILSIIARRRWLILIPFALGVAAAPLLARYAPERYRSEALILVIPQRVPDNYVKPTVSESRRTTAPFDHRSDSQSLKVGTDHPGDGSVQGRTIAGRHGERRAEDA